MYIYIEMRIYIYRYIAFTLYAFVTLTVYSQVESYDLYQNEKRHFEGVFKFQKTNVGENIDVKYHRFDWYIDPNVYYIKGNVTTYFESITDNLQQVTFDFNETLVIDSIISHQTNLSYEVNEYVLTIDLANSLSSGIVDSLTIYYHGEPPDDSGFGSFDKFMHNDGPIIWTLSEPYGAKDWWPCKQDLNDKIDSIDVIVSSPAAYRAASNGVLIRNEVVDTIRISHWKHRHPIAAYLVAIAVTNYAVYEDEVELTSGDVVDLVNYLYPGYEDDLDSRMDELKQMMVFFSEKFIDYPFKDEKYGHAQFGWSGGMEHQTMSFMGNLGYYLTAHELAHQWFGDYITCGSWAEIWLNEGFARYCEMLVMEEFHPEGVLEWRYNKISHVVSQPDGSVYVDDTTSVSRIFNGRLTYNKAGMVLHMLRKQIGDEAFFLGIKNYLNDPEVADGYAYTHQLQAHFETAADTNLTEFFNDWIYGEGYPSYHVDWNHSNHGILEIKLQQTPSHISVNFFESKIELKLIGELKDSTITVHHITNNQEFFINPGFTVSEIEFDPEHHLISKAATISQISIIEEVDEFIIIPNPAYDFVKVMNVNHDLIQNIKIVNIKGEILLNNYFYTSEEEYQFEIHNYAQGTYFFIIETKDQNYLYKFIKRD